MDNYDIRYDDKYGQLTHIDLAAEGAAHDPWVNQTLTTVNDAVVRLAVIDGRLVDWHKHQHEDEFFLVLEGRLELEVEGREPFVLGPRQGVTIPRGIVHRHVVAERFVHRFLRQSLGVAVRLRSGQPEFATGSSAAVARG